MATGMVEFHTLFPHVAEKEVRTVQVKAGSWAEEYAFVEHYCINPRCDCRRILIFVVSRTGGQVASISHGLGPQKPSARGEKAKTFLDPSHKQSSQSRDLLRVFLGSALDGEYRDRLERHYRMVKEAVRDPASPVHDALKCAGRRVDAKPAHPLLGLLFGPDCACGSGKKERVCCGRA
jgi:hypothetical protein